IVSGSVFGISNTAVTPPITALRDPVSRSSLWVRPGSRKCTCVSITPGRTCRPLQSMVSPADAPPSEPSAAIRPSFSATSQAPSGHGGGVLLDCPASLAAALTTKLGFYKLRAKVTVDNLSDNLGVLAIWDGAPKMLPDLAFADPRNVQLGWRILVPPDLAEKL